ncbi:hypothetical protein SAMN05428988_3330 [Chitinophaga sp. YR573]|nr:hypothetical protein SAMN05428988_3330 [Chitinophaga sp. YR573]
MKNEKIHIAPNSEKPYNLIRHILEDKKRIQEAIEKGVPLSSLKGINFVKPVQY